MPTLLERPAVAVVGARACSPYGSHVARTFGRELAAAGLRGRQRHGAWGGRRGAPRRARRRRVDRRRPRLRGRPQLSGRARGARPADLRQRARRLRVRARRGAVRRGGSRRGTGSSPGSCQATVVVEAREKSGALITADLALEEGSEVFAVPGEITSALSAGTNALLRLGATAATSVRRRARVVRAASAEARATRRLRRRRGECSRGSRDGPASADELVRGARARRRPR